MGGDNIELDIIGGGVAGIAKWDSFIEFCDDDDDEEERCLCIEFCDWDRGGNDCNEISLCIEFCGDNWWWGDVGIFSLLPSVLCIFWMNCFLKCKFNQQIVERKICFFMFIR